MNEEKKPRKPGSGGKRNGSGSPKKSEATTTIRVTLSEKEVILKLRSKEKQIPKRIQKSVSESKPLKKSLKEMLNEIK